MYEDKTVHAKITNQKALNKLNNVKNMTKLIEESILLTILVDELGGMEAIEKLIDEKNNIESIVAERNEFKEKFIELALNYSKQTQAPMMAYQPQTIPATQPVIQPVVQPEVKIESEEVAEEKEVQPEIMTEEVVVEEKPKKTRKEITDSFKPTEDVIEIDEDDEANEMLKDISSGWS